MHIIQKQIIELILNKAADHFQIQQKISEHYYRHIIPVLESEFDKFSSGGGVLSIEKLEIDLGCLSENTILKGKLNEELLRQVAQLVNMQLSEYINSSKAGKNGVSISENNFRQWLFYMKTGYLPWNSLIPDEKWYRNVLEAVASDYSCAAWLSSEILDSRELVERVATQHSSEFLISLTEALTANSQRTILQVLNEIKTLAEYLSGSTKEYSGIKRNPYFSLFSFEAELWKQVLILSAIPAAVKTTIHFAESILNKILPVDGLTIADVSAHSPDIKLLLPVIGKLLGDGRITDSSNTGMEIKNEFRQDENAGQKNVMGEESKSKGSGSDQYNAGQEAGPKEIDVNKHEADANSAEKDLHLQIELFNEPSQKGFSAKNEEDDVSDYVPANGKQIVPKEGIFVQNAGLVLLHPFYSSLFKHTEMVSGKQFISASSHQKALYLLHYIATGRSTAEEYELVIPKLLTGFEIGRNVSREEYPDDAERNEADNMIRAALAQWEILKNTSSDGLREGFLRRNGKVYSKNDNIYIQIEKSSIDVLLDNLPWSLSMIKLPWLNDVLRIDWR